MAEGSDVSVKHISGWAGLIADVQGLVLGLPLAHEPLNGPWRRLNLAQAAHLSLSAVLRDGYGRAGQPVRTTDIPSRTDSFALAAAELSFFPYDLSNDSAL